MYIKLATQEIREHFAILKLILNDFDSFLNLWECILLVCNIESDSRLNYHKEQFKYVNSKINNLITLCRKVKTPDNINIAFQVIFSWSATTTKLISKAYEDFDRQIIFYKWAFFDKS